MEKSQGKSIEHATGLVYSARTSKPDGGTSRSASQGWGLRLGRSSWRKNHPTLVLFGQSRPWSPMRSKGPLENSCRECQRFGARNVLVTMSLPIVWPKFSQVFFDLIVLDAPCSGEGMFRKQPDAMDYWSVDYLECSLLQRDSRGCTQDVGSGGSWFIQPVPGLWGKWRDLSGLWKTMIWSWKLSRRSMIWQKASTIQKRRGCILISLKGRPICRLASLSKERIVLPKSLPKGPILRSKKEMVAGILAKKHLRILWKGSSKPLVTSCI